MLIALVAAGLGVTVVPARVLDDAAPGVTIATQDLAVARTIHAVTRTATAATVAALLPLLAADEPDGPGLSRRRGGGRASTARPSAPGT